MRSRPSVVYSTAPELSRICPRCGSDPCRCARRRPPPPAEQTAAIRREKKGRAGKVVTVVSGLDLTPGDLQALGSRLRKECGSGGTVKDGAIEIQGDHRDRLVQVLQSLGYRTKLTGG